MKLSDDEMTHLIDNTHGGLLRKVIPDHVAVSLQHRGLIDLRRGGWVTTRQGIEHLMKEGKYAPV